ncbi:tryptophan dimethylallyltransferase-domain-containing protein [Nemania sp. NC0429]|nr:tryptophan dimethylallyltransferase-domain-containing protein [Nemania sp. NC0429]
MHTKQSQNNMGSTRTLVQTQTITFDVSYSELSAWKQEESDSSPEDDEHQRLWYHHVGKALGILLYNADYTLEAQRRSLNFFRRLVASSLGVFQGANGGYTGSWESFMTDDGTPLELSWDWGVNDSRPTIRYSVEPIGLQAGTSLDPQNLLIGPVFQDRLNQILPDARVELFDYFKEFFSGGGGGKTERPGRNSSMMNKWYNYFVNLFNGRGNTEPAFLNGLRDHNSSVFYAFDLTETEITAKAYFFPKYRASSSGKTNLEVLFESMKSAPHCTEHNLPALSVFSDFSEDEASRGLEYEMLAIDLIDPFKSRFKIYFRSRQTSFDSLTNIITLGGRIKGPNMRRGLEDLRGLWNAIFGVDTSSAQPLRSVNHRTAGMLYNVEFRIGDRFPVAKVYLPVRHYSKSDDAVIKGLEEYFRSHHRGSYMEAYRRAMTAQFGSESLAARAGIQTYVGCTIRPDGALRVVSYFKPSLSEPGTSV